MKVYPYTWQKTKKYFLQAELRKANEYAAQMKRDAQLKKEHAERKQK